jgi:predicted lysophospholipase L1 biosynthesis ABC-type transport system permease subunit
VNEAFARRYFPGEDPVGRETNRGTIVGVVGDVRNVHLDRPAEPELYYPAAQNVTMASDIGMSLLVRTEGRPEPLIQSVRAAVREANPRLAIFDIKTMEQVLDDSLWELNLYRWLIGLFATLALLLAAIGLYGVISYTAAARTREFAIRLALGSNHSALGRLVLRRGILLAGCGLACGVGGLLALTWWFDQLPAGIRPDATTASGVAVVLLAISLLACAVPAIRAAAVNPVTALRQE